MKKEIYRSFGGKLDVGNRDGYIVYQCDEFKEIHFLSVDMERGDHIARISDGIHFDVEDGLMIAEIVMDIDNGCYDDDKSAVFFNGKWYTGAMINKLQAEHGNNWKVAVK